jgi:hypothetical protein
MKGSFSAETLTMVARGIEELILIHSQIRCIVGFTKDADEWEVIEAGSSFRHDLLLLFRG